MASQSPTPRSLKALIENGQDIKDTIKLHPHLALYKGESGRTALHVAVRTGNIPAVACLLEAKTDVNAQGEYMNPPLFSISADESGMAIASMLINGKADLLYMRHKDTILHSLTEDWWHALDRKYFRSLLRLLFQNGAYCLLEYRNRDDERPQDMSFDLFHNEVEKCGRPL
jgi:ankyrin repeat protein